MDMPVDTLDEKYKNALRYQQTGRLQDATLAFSEILRDHADHTPAALKLGQILTQAGQHDNAQSVYRQALQYAPQNALLHNEIGRSFASQGDVTRAALAFQNAITLDPHEVLSYFNLGSLHLIAERAQDAEKLFRKAVTLRPEYTLAWYRLGCALCELHRIDEGFAAFERYSNLVRNWPRPQDSTPYRKKHDAEQKEWLAQRGITVTETANGLSHHAEVAGRVPGSAIQIPNAEAAEQIWAQQRPQIVVLDDFLNSDALEGLRRFCLGSTIWRREYADGYLGATPEDGIATPLLAQIAEELPKALPGIFGSHSLRFLWAFKYDSRMSGINIHADKAAVNVNFWITPDEANEDPGRGGLVVWDKAAPLDWDFDKYNGSTEACRNFLRVTGAQPTVIPYRANRVVIFDSDLFHETDRLTFKDGYENRRINMTLLYGNRKPGDMF